MDLKYYAVRIREMTDGTNSFSISSEKSTENEAAAMVCDNIAADRKNGSVLMATNFVLNSNGGQGLKDYFTHDRDLETPYFVEVELTFFTEESGKPSYKSYHEYNNEYDAETWFWQEKGIAMKDETVDTETNIVFNYHGGVEKVDNWVQYPVEPEPEPPVGE